MRSTARSVGGRGALESAVGHLAAGRPRRADQMLRKLLAQGEADPSVLHFGGVARYQCGGFNEATALLRQATAAAPAYAEAHNSLGIVLLETRAVAEARDAFQRAIAIKPDYANAYTNLGNAHREEGALDEAVSAYRTALSLDPRDLQACYRLAATFLTQGAIEQALDACEAALTLDPYCQNALATQALAEQVGGDPETGKRLYDFDRFVHRATLQPSEGDRFNSDLVTAIKEEPSLTWEPLNRVTRSGAVTQDILQDPAKPIRAFERALRAAIDAYRDGLTASDDEPFLSRIPRRYRLTMIASILTEGGWHPPHIHESAWLSGVYYVSVPDQVGDDPKDRGGWLEFGRPDFALPNDFEPSCTSYRPRGGTALFFPSYFFHGTIPFEGGGERIGIAFDAYPEGF